MWSRLGQNAGQLKWHIFKQECVSMITSSSTFLRLSNFGSSEVKSSLDERTFLGAGGFNREKRKQSKCKLIKFAPFIVTVVLDEYCSIQSIHVAPIHNKCLSKHLATAERKGFLLNGREKNTNHLSQPTGTLCEKYSLRISKLHIWCNLCRPAGQ